MTKYRKPFINSVCLALGAVLILLFAGIEKREVLAGPDHLPQYHAADEINGGRLYDTFWATETGWDQTDENIALYDEASNFFRCKQCHGWDLLGSEGAYISRAPKASRPNVSELNLREIVAGLTPRELFERLKSSKDRRSVNADLSTYDPASNATTGDQMFDLSEIFSDAQIWDLVKFLKEEAVDTAKLYDSKATGEYPTGKMAFTNIGLDGDADNGNAIYTKNCVLCHGADGTAILVDHETYSIGSFMRSKPNEAQHKIKYGQLGSLMGAMEISDSELRDLYKALSNPEAFPDPVE